MASDPFRVLRFENLNPDVPDDEIKDSLLLLLNTFKFVSVKVISMSEKDRTAYAIFRYIEDAEEAYERHRDLVLHGKDIIVSEVLLNDPILDVLSGDEKCRSLPERDDTFVPRGRGYGRGFFRGRGRGGPPGHNRRPFPTKNKFRPLSRILFIGGITPATSEQDLRRIFEPYGVVDDVDRKQNYAFIKFFNIDMSLRARRAMNGKVIDGTACRIGFGTSPPRSCLWIGRIGPWVSEKELLDEFSTFGEVEKFVWPPKKNYAYIVYSRVRHAENAYMKLQGSHFGRESKRILIEYADEHDIDSPLNYEVSTDASEHNFDDEADWNDDFNGDDYDDAEISRYDAPDSYEYDQYSSESDAARSGYRRPRMSDRPWNEDHGSTGNYSSRGRGWHGRPHDRGRGSKMRGNWRDFERNDDDMDRRHWDNDGRGGSYFNRRYEQRGRGREDFRGHNRGNRGRYERGERHGFERERYGRDNYENDRQGYEKNDRRSYERGDRRSYERDSSRSYERDDRRGFEGRDRRSYDRDDFENSRHGSSKGYSKRDRSSDGGRKYARDSRSRSPDFKRTRRSRNRSVEKSARTSFERNNELPSASAVMPDPPVQANLYSVNPLYPAPSGTLPLYPNAPGVYPQTSVVQVPGYPPVQEAFQPSTLNFYPPAAQPLPDFSVPPPTIGRFHELQREPHPTTSIVQSSTSGMKKDIASKFPVVWSGALVLKNSAFVTNMYLISGSVLLVDALLKDKSADCPVLKITQRLRLDEPDKVKEVDRRVNASGRNGCSVLLAVPASAEVGDVNNVIQQRPLSSLGSYLREKSVAAVIMLPPGSAAGSHTGILHAFPPCEFAHDFLRREAPELAKDYPKDDHLLAIVMRESGDLT